MIEIHDSVWQFEPISERVRSKVVTDERHSTYTLRNATPKFLPGDLIRDRSNQVGIVLLVEARFCGTSHCYHGDGKLWDAYCNWEIDKLIVFVSDTLRGEKT